MRASGATGRSFESKYSWTAVNRRNDVVSVEHSSRILGPWIEQCQTPVNTLTHVARSALRVWDHTSRPRTVFLNCAEAWMIVLVTIFSTNRDFCIHQNSLPGIVN